MWRACGLPLLGPCLVLEASSQEYFLLGHTLVLASWRLGACSLALGPWFVKAWSLKLLAIDHDPGAKALPGIAHDLELSCDGQQLGR